MGTFFLLDGTFLLGKERDEGGSKFLVQLQELRDIDDDFTFEDPV